MRHELVAGYAPDAEGASQRPGRIPVTRAHLVSATGSTDANLGDVTRSTTADGQRFEVVGVLLLPGPPIRTRVFPASAFRVGIPLPWGGGAKGAVVLTLTAGR